MGQPRRTTGRQRCVRASMAYGVGRRLVDEIPTTRKPVRALLHGLLRWGAAAGPCAGHGHPGRFARVLPGDDVSGGQGNPQLFESEEDLLIQPIWVCLCPRAAARR
jgi:hypothetical protein